MIIYQIGNTVNIIRQVLCCVISYLMTQLRTILNSLKRMNDTMDAAYNAITDIRSNSNNMAEYMKHISENSDVVAHNTAVAAYYAKVNASLTNALGFMVALK